jgi:hypothetical protein
MKRMDGGRVKFTENGNPIEFARVTEHDDTPLPPIPKEVIVLRDIINDFKNAILDSLTPQDVDEPAKSAQDMHLVDAAISKLQTLSNILTAVISESESFDYASNVEDIDKILQVLHERNIDVKKLDDETRTLCIHYVNNDLNHSMFDRRHVRSLD